MNQVITRYLTDVYRRDILGESVSVEMPPPDPKLIETIEREIASINRLGLGANLINRNFVLAKNKEALERLLAELKAATQQQEEVQPEPPQEG